MMANNAYKTIDGDGDARINIRTKADVRRTISHAAGLAGLDLTNFMVSAALEQARKIIHDHETIRIASAEDRAVFRAALLAPGEFNQALADLLAIPPVSNATKR